MASATLFGKRYNVFFLGCRMVLKAVCQDNVCG